MKKFKAYVTEEVDVGKFASSIKHKELSALPQNEVLVKVEYSALNYKDALVAKGHKGITRQYPHTPGVDAGGIVEHSRSAKFNVGDKVIVTGHDLGMNTSGGFADYVSVPADWLVALPNGLTIKEAMVYGTAGVTAGICVYELQKHDISPDKGNVLVTGATGGVGSMAVAILSKIGYKVVASTGKKGQFGFLKNIGASEVINRSELNEQNTKALLPRRWIGAVDTVGGVTLSNIIKSTDHNGVVCALGLVESPDFEINIFPFLQRGVSLLGINSAERGDVKKLVWNHLATDWKIACLDTIYKEVGLEDLDSEIDKILKGKQVGKVLVKI